MKKTICNLIAVWIIIIAGLCHGVTHAAVPYGSYSYDSRGNAVPSQAGYSAERSISGNDLGTGSLDSPSDIFYDENELFYIADTGNNRIIAVNSSFDKAVRIYTDFETDNGEQTFLSNPTGIFVSPERDMMYIADSGNSRVLVCSREGRVIMEITKPDDPVYDSSKTFQPRKVIADKAGNIYVQLGNITSGAAMFDPKGGFMGFYGANRTEATAEVVLQHIRNLFSSEEKRSNRTRTVPAGISGFDIQGDFVFTCTSSSSQKVDTVKKLNAAGKNIFADKKVTFGDLTPIYVPSINTLMESSIVDIDISEEGFINCLDSTTGRIFQYDEECNLIFITGEKSGQLGGFKETAAIESAEGRLFVLDSAKNTVTVFEETSFGRAVHKAVVLYNEGRYEDALAPWYEVLRRDGNYRRAYVGVASALLNKGDYKDAMKYARLGYDVDIYNKAFAGQREIFIHDNFAVIIMAAAALIILWIFRKKISGLIHRVNIKIKIKLPIRKWLNNPLVSSFFIILMMFFGQIAWGRLYGFQFGYPDDKTFSIVPYIVKSMVIFAAWVTGSRAVSTFLDGSGTAKNICISSARALVPYIVQLYICVGLSHILVQDEYVFMSIISIVGTVWTAVLLFLATKDVHGYSGGKTAFSILLTIAAMLIMLFLLVLFMSLMQQVWVFISTVFTEFTYRIRIG